MRVELNVMACPYVIYRVEREVLLPVQLVDSLETAYGNMAQLRQRWPGDYLIMEGEPGSAEIHPRRRAD